MESVDLVDNKMDATEASSINGKTEPNNPEQEDLIEELKSAEEKEHVIKTREVKVDFELGKELRELLKPEENKEEDNKEISAEANQVKSSVLATASAVEESPEKMNPVGKSSPVPRGSSTSKKRKIYFKRREDGSLYVVPNSSESNRPCRTRDLPKATRKKTKREKIEEIMNARRRKITTTVVIDDGGKEKREREFTLYSNNRVKDLIKTIARCEIVDTSKVALSFMEKKLTEPKARLGDVGLTHPATVHAIITRTKAKGLLCNPRLSDGLQKYLSAHDVQIKPKPAKADFYESEDDGEQCEFENTGRRFSSKELKTILKNTKADWNTRLECLYQISSDLIAIVGDEFITAFQRYSSFLTGQLSDGRSIVIREVCRVVRRIIKHGAKSSNLTFGSAGDQLFEIMEALLTGTRLTIKAISNPCKMTLFAMVKKIPDSHFALLDFISNIIQESPHVKSRELSENLIELMVDAADPLDMKPYHKFWEKTKSAAVKGIFDRHSKVRDAATRVLVKLHSIYPGNVVEIVEKLTRSQKTRFEKMEKILFASTELVD